MADNIRTQFHTWRSVMESGNLLVDNDEGMLVIHHRNELHNYAKLKEFVSLLDSVPHYFLTESCLPLLRSQACSKSIDALEKMGLVRLPHPHCLVEFSDDSDEGRTNKTRYFVLVSERKSKMGLNEHVYHPFECQVFMLYRPDYTKGKYAEIYTKSLNPNYRPLWAGSSLPKEWAVASRASVMLAVVPPGQIDSLGKVMELGDYHIGLTAAPWTDAGRMEVRTDTKIKTEVASAAIVAMRALLMLIRTRGIDKEVVAPRKLNAAREKRGQRKVPDHTVVYIGSYYDKSGKRVKYDPTKPGHRFQPMNMRSAHSKRVWVGSGEARRPEERLIESYIVNYVEGAELPVPKPKVVRQAGVRRTAQQGAQS